MSMPTKRTLDFGKRNSRQAEPSARAATPFQRLKKLGARWLYASGLQKKKLHSGKDAFKASRQRP